MQKINKYEIQNCQRPTIVGPEVASDYILAPTSKIKILLPVFLALVLRFPKDMSPDKNSRTR
jgi:hypothetical protein